MEQEKLDGLTRLKLTEILSPFNIYGMGTFIPEAINATIELMKWYNAQMNGEDKPFGKVNFGWKRSTTDDER